MQFSAGMGQNHPYTICKPCQVAGMGLARKAVCLSGIRYVHGRRPRQVSSSRGGDSGPDVMPGRARVSRDVLGSGVAGGGRAGCSRVPARNALGKCNDDD